MADHDCPGECGRQVDHHLFACSGCWYRLPLKLRRAITSSYRRRSDDHLDAMGDAIEWYQANPQGAPRG